MQLSNNADMLGKNTALIKFFEGSRALAASFCAVASGLTDARVIT